MHYRLYRFTSANTAYAIVPRSKVELIRHLMENSEYSKLQNTAETLRWYETTATLEYITGTYKTLAELDGDKLYILVECPW